MYAIIRDRGKQYRAAQGETFEVDLMPSASNGDAIEFNEVLLTSNSDGQVAVGAPTVAGATVSAEVVEASAKGKKIDVVHFRRRKDSMSKIGHRQKHTRIKITAIQAG